MRIKKEPTAKSRKVWKYLTVISSILVMAFIVAIPTLLILDRYDVISLQSDEKRQYSITFINDKTTQEIRTYPRGYNLSLDEMPSSIRVSPSKYITYVFSGWDITGDGSADYLGFKIYSNITAVAIFTTVRNGADSYV